MQMYMQIYANEVYANDMQISCGHCVKQKTTCDVTSINHVENKYKNVRGGEASSCPGPLLTFRQFVAYFAP